MLQNLALGMVVVGAPPVRPVQARTACAEPIATHSPPVPFGGVCLNTDIVAPCPTARWSSDVFHSNDAGTGTPILHLTAVATFAILSATMVFYALFAPLAPVIMLMCARVSLFRLLPAMICGAVASLPASLIITIVRNQFTIQRIELGASIARVLFSDYVVQILFLLLCMVLISISRLRKIFVSPESVLLFCSGFFFGEVLYRILAITVSYNFYELFLLPSLRVVLILAVYAVVHLVDARRYVLAPVFVITIGTFCVTASVLFVYNFFALSVTTLFITAASAIIACNYTQDSL